MYGFHSSNRALDPIDRAIPLMICCGVLDGQNTTELIRPQLRFLATDTSVNLSDETRSPFLTHAIHRDDGPA
jgi:hypothetical protein